MTSYSIIVCEVTHHHSSALQIVFEAVPNYLGESCCDNISNNILYLLPVANNSNVPVLYHTDTKTEIYKFSGNQDVHMPFSFNLFGLHFYNAVAD